MTETKIDRAIDDARQANEELFIRNDDGKVFKNHTSFPNTGNDNSFEISELDLAGNLSSSTEVEADTKREEEKTVRRLRKLTKTTAIVRYNNPIRHDYRKHRRNVELVCNNGSNKNRDK